MSLWTKKEKVCATCIYWQGKRDVESMFIEAKNHAGRCFCETGFYNLRTIQGSSCSNWKGFSRG
jgi:hypothetical protein